MAEAYPELKANTNFLQLQSQLQELENNIESARRYYNAVVRDYNILDRNVSVKPDRLQFNFKREELFQLEAPEAERKAPKVSFSELQISDCRLRNAERIMPSKGRGDIARPLICGLRSESRELNEKQEPFVRFFVFVTLSLNLSLILLISPAFAQFFTITKFHSDITIHRDSSFTVKETIDVKFDRPRHGIYREIPFKYRDEFGKGIVTPIRVYLRQDGTGKAWKYKA